MVDILVMLTHKIVVFLHVNLSQHIAQYLKVAPELVIKTWLYPHVLVKWAICMLLVKS